MTVQTKLARVGELLACGRPAGAPSSGLLQENGGDVITDLVLVDDWHPVVTCEELAGRKVVGARLLGEDIVVWQANGRALAWQDLCVHRGTRLSLGRVDGRTLQCPYHGWVYGADGHCVRIPALPDMPPPRKARVKTYRAVERYGLVWVSLGEPAHDVPPFPEWEDGGFRKLLCGPYAMEASGPRVVENFLDVAHFPFVHENVLGTPDRPEIADYQAVINDQGVEATGVRVYQPDPYGTGRGDWVSYTYRVLRPLTAYLLKESTGPRFSILLTITPHEPARSTAWSWMAMNYGHDIPEADLFAWQDRIFAQDRPIVESQRPELLPLDLAAELNVRADRAAVMYRRWLRQLGVSFGTA
jgi:phenylpropionate dioxygenase-like ring-hydroxylating dioxygenase large terminal subunit